MRRPPTNDATSDSCEIRQQWFGLKTTQRYPRVRQNQQVKEETDAKVTNQLQSKIKIRVLSSSANGISAD